jgi:tRNA G10  N-methylase Trm11
VITKPYPPNLQHSLRSRHGGQKPPELCADLIRIFTKKGQSVLDPFMGVGGTLLGASLSGRRAVGVEINAEWIDIYREVCRREGIEVQETMQADAEEALSRMEGRTFDCVLTDVPYWKMDTVGRSKGAFKRVNEPARPAPQSKLSPFGTSVYASKSEWLDRMRTILGLAASLLKPRGYLVSFIGDMYRDNAYHCLSAELGYALSEVPGLSWKANII